MRNFDLLQISKQLIVANDKPGIPAPEALIPPLIASTGHFTLRHVAGASDLKSPGRSRGPTGERASSVGSCLVVARSRVASGRRALASALIALLEAEPEVTEYELVTSSDLAPQPRPDRRPAGRRRPG
jgi:hypothetical protein